MKTVFIVLNFALFITPFITQCDGAHKPLEAGHVAGGSVSYEQVRPLFAQHCAACHPSRSSPDWLDYAQAKNYVLNGKLLKRIVIEKSMPPQGSAEAATFGAAERSLIAAWIHVGGPAQSESPSSPSEPEPLAANSLVQRCLGCHGTHGPESEAQPIIPRLNGQNRQYLANQLYKYQWRERVDPSKSMNEIAASLSKEDVQQVSRFFAGLAGLAPPEVAPLSENERFFLERGRALATQYCVSCHMNSEYKNGTPSPALPLLTGQSKKYLLNQLILFRDGERNVPLMNELVKTYTNDDLDALATYFACGFSSR